MESIIELGAGCGFVDGNGSGYGYEIADQRGNGFGFGLFYGDKIGKGIGSCTIPSGTGERESDSFRC